MLPTIGTSFGGVFFLLVEEGDTAVANPFAWEACCCTCISVESLGRGLFLPSLSQLVDSVVVGDGGALCDVVSCQFVMVVDAGNGDDLLLLDLDEKKEPTKDCLEGGTSVED